MEHPPSQIPFPQAGDSPLLDTLGGKRLASEGYRGEINAYHLDHHRRLASSHSHSHSTNETGSPSARRPYRFDISSSSSSSIPGESLPSIRNLLHSIGHESADQSVNLMRRSPSAPNFPSSSHFATTPSDSMPVLFPQGGSLSRAAANANANHWMGPQYSDHRQKTSSWESPAAPPFRASSPQRRPPIAPSAFAHSQYSHHANSRSDGAVMQPFRPVSASGGRGQSLRGVFASQGDGYKKQKSLHSPSSSIPSITSEELKEMPLPSLGAWKSGEEDGGASSRNVMKRSLQSQQEMEEASATSPSGNRRRHTVGALEEPHGLHAALVQSQDSARRSRKITAESTPRNSSQHMRAFATGPDSPTTPTASTGMSRFQGGPRRDSSHSISGMMAFHPSHHRLYMQHAEHATGSLPSLTSSASSTSLSSDRVRVHSLEESRERRVLPSGWASAAETFYLDKNASEQQHQQQQQQPLPSPRAPMWHSRSSTLDSLDSSSSLASIQSPFNRPLLPPRTSSLYVEENSDSAGWTATPTRRARDMAAPYAFAKERTRNTSNNMRGGDVHRSNSMRVEPVSLYSRSSLTSPSEGNLRPRAQTMVYTDRVMEPMPPQGQTIYLRNSSSSSMPSMTGRPLSSHSLSGLPQRVSSMEINPESARVRQVYDRNIHSQAGTTAIGMSSASVPSSGLHIQQDGTTSIAPLTTASHVTSVGTGNNSGPKYVCGWCGKRFSRPSSLKIHHHSHTGEKPFACPAPNCGRTFSVQSNLRRHQKCHSNQQNGKGGGNEHGPLVGYSRVQDAAPSSNQSAHQQPYMGREGAASSTHFNNLLYPFQQVAMPPSYTSPQLAMTHTQQGIQVDMPITQSVADPQSDSFMQPREQPPASSASSTAEEEEEEEEVADEDDDNSMLDVQEDDIAPRHRTALQGLLNP